MFLLVGSLRPESPQPYPKLWTGVTWTPFKSVVLLALALLINLLTLTCE